MFYITKAGHRELDFRRRESGANPSDGSRQGLQCGLESLHARQWTQDNHHADRQRTGPQVRTDTD